MMDRSHARTHARTFIVQKLRDFPVFLFLLNVITRLSGWLTASIWYDEAISLWRARLPFSSLLTDGAELQGFNLWEIFLRPFSAGPLWLLRLPAMLLSIASVYMAWLIMRRLGFTKTQISIAMIGMATLPGILWMAQDARYYAPMAFLFLLALWGGFTKHTTTLLAAAILLILVHPTGAAWAISAYMVAVMDGVKIRSILWHAPILVVVGIYKLYSLLGAQGINDFWLTNTSPVYITIQTLLAFYADTLDGWAAILGLSVITAILCIKIQQLKDDHCLGLLYLAVSMPIVIMLIVGAIYQPVLFYRTIQPGLPMFCILSGYVIRPTRRWYSWILPVATAVTIVLSIVNWDPSSRGGNIDQAAEFIERNWHVGDAIYYGTGTVAMPFKYYLPDYPDYLLDGYLNRNISWPGIPFTQAPLENVPARRIWLIYPLESTLNEQDAERLAKYSSGSVLVTRIDAIHFAPILVYLVVR